MHATETHLKGCFLLEPENFLDKRGIFTEAYNKRNLEKHIGYDIDFVQDNKSVSKKGVLRGLHFQKGDASQAKLLKVIKGEVLDVVVDIRKESETFGQYFKTVLSDKNGTMLFIPKGMAHGFLSLKEDTIFWYKCDNYYNKEAEAGIIYNDSDLNIDWNYPENELLLSDKDMELPTFKSLLS